jgi:hypothetical protein
MTRRQESAASAATAHGHAGGETFFGLAPDAVHRRPEAQSAQSWPAGKTLAHAAAIRAVLRMSCARLIPAEWRIRSRRGVSDEPVIACLGAVEIRGAPAGCFASTDVNDEPDQARDTALKRLTDYLNGDNQGAIRLDAEWPVIQQQIAARRWRVSVRLSATADTLAAAAPRAPKVKLLFQQRELLAVVRMAGRLAHERIARGDAMVLDAMVCSDWVTTGAPMIRLRRPGPVRWLIGGFEVAVPVSPRRHDPPGHHGGGSPSGQYWPAR